MKTYFCNRCNTPRTGEAALAPCPRCRHSEFRISIANSPPTKSGGHNKPPKETM